MTVEQLKGLSGGNIVKLNDILYCCLGWNFYRGPLKIYKFSAIESESSMHIIEMPSEGWKLAIDNVPDLRLSLFDISISSEKEVLEIQLKEEQNTLNEVTDKIISIKAKLEELSKPKLKIGGVV